MLVYSVGEWKTIVDLGIYVCKNKMVVAKYVKVRWYIEKEV